MVLVHYISAGHSWPCHIIDIEDAQKHFPGAVDDIKEWYRSYKIADGKAPNDFALGGRALGRVSIRFYVNDN